jgi:hypothetical protein
VRSFRTNRTGVCIGVWVLACALLAHAGEEKPRIFRGLIADTQCALNVHSLTRSHAEMLKSKATGGTEASCATYCVRYLGGDFILSSKGEVYRFDHQEKASAFAGQKVKVTGILDSKGKIIHLIEIVPAE